MTAKTSEIAIHAGRYRLALMPAIGGAVSAFDYDGEALFRTARNPKTALDMACYPLVPFSNRIRNGSFTAHGREIQLAPNFPGSDHPHSLHGQGWLAAWQLVACEASCATIAFDYQPGDWPWRYHAAQHFALSENGLTLTLSVTNHGETAMPTGLGPHPFFPVNDQTRLIAKHYTEWLTDTDSLPIASRSQATAVDWWQGMPVKQRNVDTIYQGREGPIRIEWPDRRLELTITPDPALNFTVIYTPADADFFCVEPVSHMIDAHNQQTAGTGLVWLEKNETLQHSVSFAAQRL